jgi:MFS family permease
MLITQSLAMCQALLLGILAATDTVQIWHIYVLAAMLGSINALDGPLRQSFVSELVDREGLPNAIALNSLVQNLGRILGPAAGGAVIGFFGVSTAFFLNAASFSGILTALLLIDRAQLRPRAPLKNRGRNVFKDVGEGLSFARRTPPVLFLLILTGFIGMFGQNFGTMIPLVAKYLVHASANQFGILNSCLGSGSFLAAMVLTARGRPSSRRIAGGATMFGVVLILIGLSHSFLLTGVLFVCVGAAAVTFNTGVQTAMQLMAPESMRGRMASLNQLLIGGSSPIGGELTGFIASTGGVSGAVVFNGLLCCTGVLVAILYRIRVGTAASTLEAAPSAHVSPAAAASGEAAGG